MCDGGDGLGVGEPDARRYLRTTGARTEVNATTFGCGFFSLKIWMLLTWSAAVIGLVTETESENGIAVLHQRGHVKLHLGQIALPPRR